MLEARLLGKHKSKFGHCKKCFQNVYGIIYDNSEWEHLAPTLLKKGET